MAARRSAWPFICLLPCEEGERETHQAIFFSSRTQFYTADALSFLTTFLATPLGAGKEPANGNVTTNEGNVAARVIETITAAWNSNDTETIAQLFLPSATLVMPTGSVLQSRAAIKQRLTAERSGKLKDTTLQANVGGISFPGRDAALVRGKYQLRGMKILGIETSPAGSFVFHQRKQQGRWMIVKADISREQAD